MDTYQAQLRYYSRRAVQVINLFRSAFGASGNRVIRVLGSQGANPGVSNTILSFENASAGVDALAIAPYFGGGYGSPTGGPQVQNFTVADLISSLRTSEMPQVFNSIAAQVTVARNFGVSLITYEGGQHLVGYSGQENNVTLDALFNAANRSDLMEGLYDEYLAGWWMRNPGGLFMHYKHAGSYTKFTKFGSYEYLNQPLSSAPKARALQNYIELHR